MHYARSAFLGRPRASDLPLLIPDEPKATELPTEDEPTTYPIFSFSFHQLVLDWPQGIVERSAAHAELAERDGAEPGPAAVAADALAQSERRQQPAYSLDAPVADELIPHAA